MSAWSSTRARRVLAALLRMGWRIKRQDGSPRVLSRPEWPAFVFAFHDAEEIGPRMLPLIAKRTGLQPQGLERWHDHHFHHKQGMDPTTYSVRSYVAPASRRG